MREIQDVKEAKEIYSKAICNFIGNDTEWKEFLKFSSKLYKYKFHENILLFAQNRNATICAEFNDWKKVGRYVKPKPHCKSLKTLYYERGKYYLKTVFDIADTNSKYNVDFKLWKATEKETTEILEQYLDYSPKPRTFKEVIYSYLTEVIQDPNTLEQIGLSEEEVYNQEFLEPFFNSVGHIVANRCGFEYSEEIRNFNAIKDTRILKVLGYLVNKCSYDLLKIVELEINEREVQENGTSDISEIERIATGIETSQAPRLDNGGDNKRGTGEIREGDSEPGADNRRTIKKATSKAKYRRVRGNSPIREHDTNSKNGTNAKNGRRSSKRNVNYAEGVEQTTLFDLQEYTEEIAKISDVNILSEVEKPTEVIEPAIPLFKIPDNLKEESTNVKKKYEENITAIKLLKQLEKEERPATDEEKLILAKYNGWGGQAKAFVQFSEQYAELSELLTEEELVNARESCLTSFYTDSYIIDFMYKAIQQFGINQNCKILDPSAGIGNFLGRIPDELANSNITAIEKDSLTGRILKYIYTETNIQIAGYEDTTLSNNHYDVAITNIPFRRIWCI